MGIYSWDLDDDFISPEPVRNPRPTAARTPRPPRPLRSHDEFVVETDKAGEAPMPFWSETVLSVMVE